MCQATSNSFQENDMRRSRPNKRRSVKAFKKGARKTHRKNIQIMRGGWRL